MHFHSSPASVTLKPQLMHSKFSLTGASVDCFLPHLPLRLMAILTYLRLRDHGGFAVTQGGKGEAELDLLISLEETQTRCVNGALKSAV